MLKMCIVDLDGVIADSTERFKRAEEAKYAYLEGGREKAIERYNRTGQPWTEETINKKATDIYWQTAFTPELIALDAPIKNAYDHLGTIYGYGYHVVFLTSRPESMRKATMQWLFQHFVKGASDLPYYGESPLVMKSLAFQYTETPVWKAGMVQTLAALHGATIVKFVDDEEANWQEILKHTPYTDYSLQWLSSLRDMVRFLEEGEGHA